MNIEIISENYKGYRIEEHSQDGESEFNAYGIKTSKGDFEGYSSASELKLTIDLEENANADSDSMNSHFIIGGIA